MRLRTMKVLELDDEDIRNMGWKDLSNMLCGNAASLEAHLVIVNGIVVKNKYGNTFSLSKTSKN